MALNASTPLASQILDAIAKKYGYNAYRIEKNAFYGHRPTLDYMDLYALAFYRTNDYEHGDYVFNYSNTLGYCDVTRVLNAKDANDFVVNVFSKERLFHDFDYEIDEFVLAYPQRKKLFNADASIEEIAVNLDLEGFL